MIVREARHIAGLPSEPLIQEFPEEDVSSWLEISLSCVPTVRFNDAASRALVQAAVHPQQLQAPLLRLHRLPEPCF